MEYEINRKMSHGYCTHTSHKEQIEKKMKTMRTPSQQKDDFVLPNIEQLNKSKRQKSNMIYSSKKEEHKKSDKKKKTNEKRKKKKKDDDDDDDDENKGNHYICANSNMDYINENADDFIWEGLLKKDVILILLQAIKTMGYNKAAKILELESGIQLEQPLVKEMHKNVLLGKWKNVMCNLKKLNINKKLMKAIAFLIYEQCFIEYLYKGKQFAALRCLRNKLSKCCFDDDTYNRLHECTTFFMYLNNKELQNKKKCNFKNSRKALFDKINRLLPESVIIPPRRLAILLHQSLKYQVDNCLFHNNFSEINLLKNILKKRERERRKKSQILTCETNERKRKKKCESVSVRMNNKEKRVQMKMKEKENNQIKKKKSNKVKEQEKVKIKIKKYNKNNSTNHDNNINNNIEKTKTTGTNISGDSLKKMSSVKCGKKEITLKKKKIKENKNPKHLGSADTENDLHCISKIEKQKKESVVEKEKRNDKDSTAFEEDIIKSSCGNNNNNNNDNNTINVCETHLLQTNVKSKFGDCADSDINVNKRINISVKEENEIDISEEKKKNKKLKADDDFLKLGSKRKHAVCLLDAEKTTESSSTVKQSTPKIFSNSNSAEYSNEPSKRNLDCSITDTSKKTVEKGKRDNSTICIDVIDSNENEEADLEKKTLSKSELVELVNAVNKNMSCDVSEYINDVWSVEKNRNKEEKKLRQEEKREKKKKCSKKNFFEKCNNENYHSNNSSNSNNINTSFLNMKKKNSMKKRKKSKLIGDKEIQCVKSRKRNNNISSSMIYSISLLKNHECQRIRLPYYCIKILQGHKDEVWHASISANGKYIASSSKDKTIILWSGNSPFAKLREWLGHVDGVSNICWSHNSKYLVSGSNDSNIIIWSPKSNKKKIILSMHSAPITSICWSKDDSMIISSGYDKKVFCTKLREDLKKYDVLYAWSFNTRIQNAIVTNDDKYLVVVASDKNVRILDFRLKTELYTLPEFDSITSVCASSLYNHILVNVGDQKPTIKLWDVKYRYIIQTYRGHKQGRFIVHSTFGGKNENYVISGSEDSLIYIWHKTKGYLLDIINGHASTVNIAIWPISYSKFPYMVSASDDHTLMIWSVRQKINKKKEMERKNGDKKKKKKKEKKKDKKAEKYKALTEKKESGKLFMHPFLRELRQLSLKEREEEQKC